MPDRDARDIGDRIQWTGLAREGNSQLAAARAHLRLEQYWRALQAPMAAMLT